MTSEIRVNKIANRAGLSTVEYTDTGIIVSGIVTCTEISGLNALNIAGVSTFASPLDINGDIDVDGHTNLDNLSVAGVSTFSDDVTLTGASYNVLWDKSDNQLEFGDNAKLSLGASSDLQLYHNGNNSYVKSSTGNLWLGVNNYLNIAGGSDFGTYMARFLDGGAVELRYNNTTRFETTNTGAVVTGICAATSFSGSGASLTNLPSAQLTGALPAIDGSNLTGIAGPTINNNANTRVITASGNANEFDAQAGLTFSTSSNDPKLTITGSGHAQLFLTNTSGSDHTGVNFGDSADTNAGMIQYSNSNNAMQFHTNGAERFRIDSSGNFMIGSTSAEAKLDVTGGVSISSNGVTVSPSGYDLKIRSNTGKLGIHIDNSSGTPTLEFGTGNATTGGAIITNSYGIFLKPGNVDKLKVEPDGVRSFATFVDTSYHANPDPIGDGSGIAYYRLNYNFQDSGRFGNHGQGIQGGDPTFALVNSSGEPCWNNPTDGAINLPNLKNSYPFSMAAWINVSSWPTSADNDVIMNLSIGSTRVTLCICCWSSATSDGADFYIMYGGQGHHYFRPTSKPTNTWIHVVYSVVGSDNGGHRVYQNGADLTTRGNRGGGHGGSAGWAMGGNAGNSERFAMGRIGSIRFFNKALTASEANTLYQNDTFYT